MTFEANISSIFSSSSFALLLSTLEDKEVEDLNGEWILKEEEEHEEEEYGANWEPEGVARNRKEKEGAMKERQTRRQTERERDLITLS